MYITIDQSHDTSAVGKVCIYRNPMLDENVGQNHRYISIERRIYSLNPFRLKETNILHKLIISGKNYH